MNLEPLLYAGGYCLIGCVAAHISYRIDARRMIASSPPVRSREVILSESLAGMVMVGTLWPIFLFGIICITVLWLPAKFIVSGGDRIIAKELAERDKLEEERAFWNYKKRNGNEAEKESARIWLEAH